MRGSVGSSTSVIDTGIKKDRIKSNCWKCIYRSRLKGMKHDEMYCSYYKVSNPGRKTCARFEKNKKYGKRVGKKHDQSCGLIKWKDLQLILLKEDGNLQKFKSMFCSECRHNDSGDCMKFGRRIDDLTKLPTEIEKWK